jgi:hypothetical protein
MARICFPDNFNLLILLFFLYRKDTTPLSNFIFLILAFVLLLNIVVSLPASVVLLFSFYRSVIFFVHIITYVSQFIGTTPPQLNSSTKAKYIIIKYSDAGTAPDY